VLKGFIKEKPAKILIDPGGEINFLSRSFCKHHRIKFKETEELAEMANGVDQPLNELLFPASLQMKTYTEPLYFAVSPLPRYDAIIGKEWCSSHRAKIDCFSNEIEFKHKDKTHVLVADEVVGSPFVSANSIMITWKSITLLLPFA